MPNLKSLEEAACELPNTLTELEEVVDKYGLAKTDVDGVDKYDFDKLKVSLDAAEKVPLYDSLLRKYNDLRDKLSKDMFDKFMKVLTLLAAIGAGVVAYLTLDNATKSFQAGNFYRVESDLTKSLAQVDYSRNKALAATLYEIQFIQINDLYSHAGISENAWKILLDKHCKSLKAREFKLGGVVLQELKKICDDKDKAEMAEKKGG